MQVSSKVSKFVGCHYQVASTFPSGKNQDDIVSDAVKLFKTKWDHDFTLQHCWMVLRTNPKFMSVNSKTRKPRTPKSTMQNQNENAFLTPIPTMGSICVSDEESNGFERPIGRKRAKANLKVENDDVVNVEEKKCALLKRNVEAFEEMNRNDLMKIDEASLSRLTEAGRRYFQIKQDLELKKMMKELEEKNM
jgi:hypothetical protein